MNDEPILRVEGLSGGYGVGWRSSDVVHDISFSLPAGSALALVGESGSGKSTLGKMLSGQLRYRVGTVMINGRDVTALRGRRRILANAAVQLVPQDPMGSLDPFMRIGESIAEGINPRNPSVRRDRARIEELLAMVSMPTDILSRKPHEFSGGQRQRIVIARALGTKPAVMVADEVTSALDLTVRGEILALLKRLRSELGLSMVFITHDLSIAHYLCDDVVVLNRGRIVEQGKVGLLANPRHDYTRALVASVPDAEGLFLDG